MLFWRKKESSYERAMNWFKQHMVAGQGIIVHTKQPVPYPEVTGYFIPTLYNWGEKELARTCTRCNDSHCACSHARRYDCHDGKTYSQESQAQPH